MSRFQQCILSDQSDVLVNSNCDRYAMARCSPISLLCCALIYQLCQQKGSKVLFFFCGMHNVPDARLAGPVGLVKCLIAQLLVAEQFDLHFLSLGLREQELYADNLQVLCETLRELVVQKPGIVLFCIIDGASLFETREWSAEMEFVVLRLASMVADRSIGATFKLLITSPGVNRTIKCHPTELSNLSPGSKWSDGVSQREDFSCGKSLLWMKSISRDKSLTHIIIRQSFWLQANTRADI
ncbi:hypothetical protein VTN77DRAFT_4513 [Rasamsonia byssochlamydoides]|uniref:uncharacterized protein n=1 Tax=Rasamsonia byssochlamydoides TaxID=89139 RepID=UPI0037427570